MKHDYSNELRVIKQAALAAGDVLLKYFSKKISVKIKSTNADFVTVADLQANKAITEIVNKNLPKVSIYSEENKTDSKGKEFVLIVDPLDGTNNFVTGIPVFSSALTLLHQGKPVCSVINLPLSKQMFWSDGKYSYLNKTKLYTSKVIDIRKSIFAYQQDYLSDIRNKTSFEFKSRRTGVTRVLNNWSPQFEYSLLAAGKIQGIYARRMVAYDYLAGLLLATRAGAKVFYIKENENIVEGQISFIIAGNQVILNKMREIINI